MKYKTIFEAARTKLRAEALSSLSSVELLLNAPHGNEADTVVDKVVESAKLLAMYEGALITLNQYFEPKQPQPASPPTQVTPQPPMPATPTPDPGPPIRVTEENSPTYKRAVEKEKIKSSVRRATATKTKATRKTTSKSKKEE